MIKKFSFKSTKGEQLPVSYIPWLWVLIHGIRPILEAPENMKEGKHKQNTVAAQILSKI